MDDGNLRRGAPSDRSSPARAAEDEASDRSSGWQGRMRNGIKSGQIKWTNEKHSMYLNYIEETFVNQLYSCDYQLTDSLDHPPRIQNNMHPSGSNLNDFCSSQFTSHRRGGQEKSNFERSRNYKTIQTDPCFFSSNTCIQHLSSYSSGYEASSSSMQLPSSITNICFQGPVGSGIEMSDQNFVDSNHNEEKQVRRTCRSRRTRNAASANSQKDQVVLHGENYDASRSGTI